MKTSITDVAAEAGVSTATVSRVFSHPERVSEKTQQKVLDAAKKLNFYISRSAAVLKSGQTKRIALLVGSAQIDWFTGLIIEGLNHVFRDARYDLVLYPITTLDERREFFDTLPLRGNVDAVIVSSFAISPDEVSRLQEAHMPVVGINVLDTTGFTASVSIDDFEGTALGLHYLAQLGHQHIAFCYENFGEGLHFSSTSRLDGFVQACEREGITYSLIHFSPDDAVFDAVYSALSAPEHAGATALFFHRDYTALAFCVRFREMGMRIPAELSVLGYDNSIFADVVGLSTIKQRPREMAIQAAEKTLRLLEGDESAATHDVAPVQLIVRSTTGAPRE
ncbi:LacI family DNA-binding transcriptional regulator [Alloscardovia macacae]|uniref:LacI family transcriptional regulator n=1 Tax=Alloscardovia macacae TaxID=1160091 RepID=A0A261F035_9BIFI|nr:LacI family DNA-binding transcriptional regulator [Alloscardovia macacae]OZG52471.1 LacI family transcriptional regulator [Alloscardovia macacae]